MSIRREGDYWVDEQSNRWSTKKYSEHAANIASMCLYDCYHCTDLHDSRRCRWCVNGNDLESCVDCKDCVSCTYCVESIGCTNCNGLFAAEGFTSDPMQYAYETLRDTSGCYFKPMLYWYADRAWVTLWSVDQGSIFAGEWADAAKFMLEYDHGAVVGRKLTIFMNKAVYLMMEG